MAFQAPLVPTTTTPWNSAKPIPITSKPSIRTEARIPRERAGSSIRPEFRFTTALLLSSGPYTCTTAVSGCTAPFTSTTAVSGYGADNLRKEVKKWLETKTLPSSAASILKTIGTALQRRAVQSFRIDQAPVGHSGRQVDAGRKTLDRLLDLSTGELKYYNSKLDTWGLSSKTNSIVDSITAHAASRAAGHRAALDQPGILMYYDGAKWHPIRPFWRRVRTESCRIRKLYHLESGFKRQPGRQRRRSEEKSQFMAPNIKTGKYLTANTRPILRRSTTSPSVSKRRSQTKGRWVHQSGQTDFY